MEETVDLGGDMVGKVHESRTEGTYQVTGWKRLLLGFLVPFCLIAGSVLGDYAAFGALPLDVVSRPVVISAAIALLLAPAGLWTPWGVPLCATAAVLLVAWHPRTILIVSLIWLLLVSLSIRRIRLDLAIPTAIGSVIFAVVGIVQTVSVLDEPLFPTPGPTPAYERSVYMILLDGYPRADTLEAMGIDNRAFIEELQSRGFDHYEEARSEHRYTWRTLAAMFGEDRPADGGWGVVEDRRSARRQLRLPPGFVMISQFHDHFTIPGAVDLAGNGLNGFEVSLLSKTPVAGTKWVERLIVVGLRRGLETALRTLEEAPQKHIFAHLIAPHGPFIFSRDGGVPPLPDCWPSCNPFENTFEGVGMSLQQWVEGMSSFLDVLNPRILAVVDKLMGRDPDAIMVIMSDHGARYSDSEPDEWYRSLLVARTPGTPGVFGLRPTPRQVVRATLDLAVGSSR